MRPGSLLRDTPPLYSLFIFPPFFFFYSSVSKVFTGHRLLLHCRPLQGLFLLFPPLTVFSSFFKLTSAKETDFFCLSLCSGLFYSPCFPFQLVEAKHGNSATVPFFFFFISTLQVTQDVLFAWGAFLSMGLACGLLSLRICFSLSAGLVRILILKFIRDPRPYDLSLQDKETRTGTSVISFLLSSCYSLFRSFPRQTDLAPLLFLFPAPSEICEGQL